jgi:nucleolar protein 58
MIVQAIGLLDELDKEINTYAMRVREWYGWHFPEMAKVINTTIIAILFVLLMCAAAVSTSSVRYYY